MCGGHILIESSGYPGKDMRMGTAVLEGRLCHLDPCNQSLSGTVCETPFLAGDLGSSSRLVSTHLCHSENVPTPWPSSSSPATEESGRGARVLLLSFARL